jgi:hypothetical protein
MAKITPSDIDAELSKDILFNREMFENEMNKLRIRTKITDDGWRFHVVFDLGGPTGGFTADLIQPYCYISHDAYDFDVNVLYIKKDHLKQIGMKIPLKLEPIVMNNNIARPDPIRVSIESLITSCRSMQMRRTRADIYQYRIDKFKSRGWIISNDVFSPVTYKSFVTLTERVTEEHLKEIDPNWIPKMPNFKIIRTELLSNTSWKNAYESTVAWIREEAGNQDVNQKLLYHGTGEEGAKGIMNNGFDSRYFSLKNNYGRGVYLADDPAKSHDYTSPDANKCRYMFIARVALGTQEVLQQAQNNKMGPSKGFHSILGQAGKHK